jgi:hypothetical protein
MFPSTDSYQFAVSLKFENIRDADIRLGLTKSPHSILMTSRKFEFLDEAIASCDGTISSVCDYVNAHFEKAHYRVVAEINPEISGLETFSIDWEENELSKLWIIGIDEDLFAENAEPIKALAFANIIETSKENND